MEFVPPDWFLPRKGAKTLYRDKPLTANTTYHVFNRRDDGAAIFRDAADRDTFIDAMRRVLRPDVYRDARGRSGPPIAGGISLLSYCLLDNHFHLIVHQLARADAMSHFMRRSIGAYTQHFNRRHGRAEPLFDQCYQARPVTSARYLKNLIAYVHANSPTPLDERWSSHALYAARDPDRLEAAAWCDVATGMRVYANPGDYAMTFLRAVEDRRARRAAGRTG